MENKESIYAPCENCGHSPMILVRTKRDSWNLCGVYKCTKCGYEVTECKVIDYWT
jgi:predicted RNA-binding Zn-ribbon protein involved in translation (DUF1610 family)